MTHETYVVKAFRRLMLVPLIAVGFLSIVATGGGGGGGGGGIPESPATITTTNAAALINDVIGTSDPTGGIAAASTREGTTGGQSLSSARALAQRLETIYQTTLNQVQVTSQRFAPAIPVDETEPCDFGQGTIHFTGNINPDGTGTLTATYNNCVLDGLTHNGQATLQVTAFDLTFFVPTDFTFSISSLTITGPGINETVSGSLRDQLNLATDTETTTFNLTTTDNVSGKTTKTHNLVFVFVYNDIFSPTSYTLTITGRVWDSLYGYVDVLTVAPFVFANISQLFPDSGQIILTGAGNASIQVTALSSVLLTVELDLDGDSSYELIATLKWTDLDGPIGADLGDDDGDGMHNSWETFYGLDPLGPADAGFDGDGDVFANLGEYLNGTDPNDAASKPTNAFSVSGTVAGLAGSGLVLQNNSGDDLAVSGNGAFLFAIPIADGGTYNVTVLSQPTSPAQTCSVTNGSGKINGANVTNVSVDCVLSLSVTPLYPNNGTNWNDYVSSDGANRFVASDTVCDFTADTYYSSCIHGGEYRLAEIAGVTSCSGLTATDALDVFNWACDDSSGVARIISTGLKDNMHLSDLIDWSGIPPQWLANSVTVNNGTSDIATSSSTAWWSNPIVTDNDGGSLAAAGTIYVVTSDPNADYTMDADKIGLVVQPGVTLHGAGIASSASVTANDGHHLWLEGVIDPGLFVGTAINWNPVHFSVLRNVTVVNAQDGIFFNQAPTGNLLSHILVSNAHNGLWLSTGRWNILRHVTVTNTRANGITAPQFSTLIDITAANNTDGVGMIFGSDNNISLNVTSVNNNNGITTSAAHRNTMMNLAAVNNNTGGIVTGSSDSNRFANLLATENSYGVQENNSNFNSFTGLLKVGNNDIFDCVSSLGTPGLESVTCANAGSSDATLTTGVSAAASFVEKVTVDDTSNTSDTNGSASYNSITDWASFDNPYRGWGKDSNDAFPNPLHALRCTAIDTCRIWDWSLANGDTGDGGSPAVQDALSLPTGDNTLTHTWQAPTNAAACNLIPGAVWNAGAGTCTSTFLRNAVEIIDDGLGNENGLCESNETCLFTPNIGSYQGHGNRIPAGAFTDGTITGVTLLRYETNGY